MYDYIKKNGDTVTIFDIDGNDIKSRIVDNTSNIDEYAYVCKKHLEKLSELKSLRYEVDCLLINSLVGKGLIGTGIVLGTLSGMVANSINYSGLTFIPYLIGGVVASSFSIYGINNILKYKNKDKELMDKIEVLENECNFLCKKKLELQQSAIKVSTYEECKKIENKKYYSSIINYMIDKDKLRNISSLDNDNAFIETQDKEKTLVRKLY